MIFEPVRIYFLAGLIFLPIFSQTLFLFPVVSEETPRIGGITMTNEQKNTIKKMREKLCSYTEISNVLGISTSSVKSYCYRNKLNTDALTKEAKRCKYCGKPILSKSKTKPRVFCDDVCKVTWWKKHKASYSSTFVQELTCPTCGTKFTAYKSANRKYCSQNCYQRRNCNG